MLDALHDVAVVMADDDRPAAFGRDLGTDPLAFDPLVPQVVRLAIRSDTVGDHVGVEVVGVLMRGQHVLALLHADRLEQPFRVADYLLARRPFVLGIGDDQVIDGIVAAPGQRRDRLHLDRSRLHRRDAAQMHPLGFLRCARIANATFEGVTGLRDGALVGVLGDVVDADREACGYGRAPAPPS